MRPLSPLIRPLLITLGLGGFACVGLFLVGVWYFGRQMELGLKPPNQVFTSIFRMPVPKGVSQMQVEGKVFTSGTFWMRFRANNIKKVLTTMQSNTKVPVSGPVNKADLQPYDLSSIRRMLAADPHASPVGWSRALTLPHAEYYTFCNDPMGVGWTGTLIVDRRQHLFYAMGGIF